VLSKVKGVFCGAKQKDEALKKIFGSPTHEREMNDP